MLKHILYTKYFNNNIVSFEIKQEDLKRNKSMFPKGEDSIVQCFVTEIEAIKEKQETIDFINFLNIGSNSPLIIQ